MNRFVSGSWLICKNTVSPPSNYCLEELPGLFTRNCLRKVFSKNEVLVLSFSKKILFKNFSNLNFFFISAIFSGDIGDSLKIFTTLFSCYTKFLRSKFSLGITWGGLKRNKNFSKIFKFAQIINCKKRLTNLNILILCFELVRL